MSLPSLARRIADLETALLSPDSFGPSTDMPFAIFVYEPTHELEMRKEVELLRTRLQNEGRDVSLVDLGKLMWECLRSHPGGPEALFQLEKSGEGLSKVVGDARTLLIGSRQDQAGPLERRVIAHLRQLDQQNGIGLLMRAGELFPIYRTSALLERMISVLRVRTVLFFPGTLRGATELSFMGVREPSPNYRPRIFAAPPTGTY